VDVQEVSLEQVRQLAGQVFGSDAAAAEWLGQPAMALDRQVPEELLSSEAGRRLVHTLLVQLAHCVYV
jgi:putative toxin-antitoxin system antitoxin component (TIGR02293 family)